MILPSTITDEASTYISGRLTALAEAENVRILFAIESGSRAWGFPSADSDYDIRFIYIRPRADYLTVRQLRDVIETPIRDDALLGVPFDLNGWDIRKALRLGLTSNPVLHEWSVSPIRYLGDDNVVEYIRAFITAVADRTLYRYHYDRLCRSAWTQMAETPDQAVVKRYCYALRPALTLRWLDGRSDGLPPMDAASLAEGLDEETRLSLADLFAKKASGGEKDVIPRVPALDHLIDRQLAVMPPRPKKTEPSAAAVEAADALFSYLLG